MCELQTDPECDGCGAPAWMLEHLPDEANYYCSICGVRTPDDVEPDKEEG